MHLPEIVPEGSVFFDTLFRRATVYDGLGGEPLVADIGVRGGKISAIGDLSSARGGVERNLESLAICPGFLDIHTHSDLSVLFTSGMESSLAQGVTTEVCGNCGFSLGLATDAPVYGSERRALDRAGVQIDWDDLDGFVTRVNDSGVATNLFTLAGHGTLRKRVMGLAERAPDAGELSEMARLLDGAMAQGALGLSTGLEYVPGAFATLDELVALATVAGKRGGFYATHLRDEGDFLFESVDEAIEIARRANLPLQLSHHKAERVRNWGKVRQTLATIDAARESGLDILLDQYPYDAYQTSLATIALPPWAVGGTPDEMARKLRDPELRMRARDVMGDGLDWSRLYLANAPNHPDWQGERLDLLADAHKTDVRDFVLNLLAEGTGWVSAIHFAMSDDDIEFVLRDPHVAIGSDSVATAFSGPLAQERPHPRSFGTFTRVLGEFARKRNVLSFSEAVRRMTSLPASRLGVLDRGRVAVGAWADLVILSPEMVIDTATFFAPHSVSDGIDSVYVAGTLAWNRGASTGSRTGKMLRRV